MFRIAKSEPYHFSKHKKRRLTFCNPLFGQSVLHVSLSVSDAVGYAHRRVEGRLETRHPPWRRGEGRRRCLSLTAPCAAITQLASCCALLGWACRRHLAARLVVFRSINFGVQALIFESAADRGARISIHRKQTEDTCFRHHAHFCNRHCNLCGWRLSWRSKHAPAGIHRCMRVHGAQNCPCPAPIRSCTQRIACCSA